MNEDAIKKIKEEYHIFDNVKSIEHSKIDIMLASFISGCIAGIITNPIEYLAVRK